LEKEKKSCELREDLFAKPPTEDELFKGIRQREEDGARSFIDHVRMGRKPDVDMME